MRCIRNASAAIAFRKRPSGHCVGRVPRQGLVLPSPSSFPQLLSKTSVLYAADVKKDINVDTFISVADLCDAHIGTNRDVAKATDRGVRLVVPRPNAGGLGGGWVSFGRPSFFGQVSTVVVPESNSAVRDVLKRPGHGHVLVIDTLQAATHAVVGDQIAALAEANGWEGIIVNGFIRDAAAIRALRLGVFALGTCPVKSYKGIGATAGEADVAVAVGGTAIRPGEWIYADGDGVLVATRRLH
eukprot:TRINITY_DN53523_c0_g1_i1.p1 TRINITY_DN53523_c0_g1~~TRINITY_DN53523_c0_g1_i1.p1  ORF type:complete len:242 (+),score=28.81 TRINITY_DN53523_c0_g1_i1:127-852(+)